MLLIIPAGRLPQVINDDVVETAKNRVHLLRETCKPLMTCA